jgi:hypothetical protein
LSASLLRDRLRSGSAWAFGGRLVEAVDATVWTAEASVGVRHLLHAGNDFFGPLYRLVGAHSGKVLEVSGGNYANGVPIRQ